MYPNSYVVSCARPRGGFSPCWETRPLGETSTVTVRGDRFPGPRRVTVTPGRDRVYGCLSNKNLPLLALEDPLPVGPQTLPRLGRFPEDGGLGKWGEVGLVCLGPGPTPVAIPFSGPETTTPGPPVVALGGLDQGSRGDQPLYLSSVQYTVDGGVVKPHCQGPSGPQNVSVPTSPSICTPDALWTVSRVCLTGSVLPRVNLSNFLCPSLRSTASGSGPSPTPLRSPSAVPSCVVHLQTETRVLCPC